MAVGIILLFVGTCIIPAIAQNIENRSVTTMRGNWLYVGGDGPGNYSKIQDAVDNASDGDTVFVFKGIYNESVYISKSIIVLGEDKYNTVIDGQFKIPGVVKFLANSIYFSGFSIIHSRSWANDFGMSISSYNVVVNNIISENHGGWGGIKVDGSYNQINNNIIKRGSSDGILIGHTAFYNIISGNTINDNNIGIWLAANQDNVITGNHIHNNSYEGIMIRGVGYSEVSNNIIENNNGAAIKIEWDTSNVVVEGNIIKNNGEGLVIDDAQSLIVEMNSFYVEGIQLTGDVLNYWTSHSISNNLINGKPIYFFKSEKDLIVPSDAGQLILVDCTNCLMKNLHISNVDYGIQLGFSSKNTISNNQFINTTETAINLQFHSHKNKIFNNYIFNSNNCGVIVSKSLFNNFSLNNFSNNKIGVRLDSSFCNRFLSNNFINNLQTHATFVADGPVRSHNTWKYNYWDGRIWNGPKVILGCINTHMTYMNPFGDIYNIYLTSINVDWHPAQEPYDIGE